ncbi:MAG: hypothetical protein F8N38_05445 [Hungatella sp.]|nr:hypothetical protein [Hungatella sp.]
MKKNKIFKFILSLIGYTIALTVFYFIFLIVVDIINKGSLTENFYKVSSIIWFVLYLISWVLITINYINSKKSEIQKLIDTEFKAEEKYRGLYALIFKALLSKNVEYISQFNGIRAEYMSDLLSIPIIGLIFTIYLRVADNYDTLYYGLSNLLTSGLKLKDMEILPIDTLYTILILIVVLGAINALIIIVNEHYFLKVYEDVKNDFANRDFKYAKLIFIDDIKKTKEINDMENEPSTELNKCEQRLKDLIDLADMIEDDIEKFKTSPDEVVRYNVPRHEAWVKRCREIDIPETELKLLKLKEH